MFKQKRKTCSFHAVSLLLLSLVLSSYSYGADPVKIKVATVDFVGDATLYYAYRKGFFLEQGLEVELVRNSAGVESMKQVISGEVQIGTVAPTPIVYLVQGRIDLPSDIRIIASVYQSSNLNSLVILDGDNFSEPRQLLGKKVGLQQQTAAEYFWYRILVANNLQNEQIEVVNIATRDLAAAAKKGSIDAAVAWSPFHLDVVNAVQSNAKVISGTAYATEGWYVVAHPQFIKENPGIVKSYLAALKRAEQVIRANPQDVASYHAEIVDSSAVQLTKLYDDVSFSLNLAESDLFHLQQQGQWAYRVGYVDKPAVDYRTFIDTWPLSQISPEAIKLLE